jgi:hypothetical protein
MQHLGDLDAFVTIGDRQIEAAQTAPGQLAQEPVKKISASDDTHAEHFAAGVTLAASHDDHRDLAMRPLSQTFR